MLDAGQARALEDTGLDDYNHDLDSAPGFYYGDKLPTTTNPQAARDRALFDRLGLPTR
jgi:biotin synthase-like enzyme